MPFAPVIPLGGLAGWRFLERTQARQTELFNRSPDLQRDVEYFKENIRNVTSTAELVGDRRLLTVALGAYGLSDELNKQAFVRTVLDGGVIDPRSFANRLGNSDYVELTEMFSFADGGFVATDIRVEEITSKFLENAFEESVGDVDPAMRLALNFKREMSDIANAGHSETTGWYKALGSLPIRKVLEAAFNLPTEFSQIDLDQQKDVLIDKAKQLFGNGSVDVFADPEKLDDAIRRFHLREQINNGPSATTPGYTALILLGGTGNGVGSSGILNLLLSNN